MGKIKKLIYAVGAYKVFEPLVDFAIQYQNDQKDLDLSKYKSPGAWALISGSSDGMGKIYAQKLAKQGFNVAISSFNKKQLLEFKNELLDSCPQVEVSAFHVDYSKTIDYSEQLNTPGLRENLRLLVNNVGALRFGAVFDQPPADMQLLMKVNVYPQILYCKYAHQSFKIQEGKRCGVVQVASMSAPRPYVFAVIYGCTKRMHRNFALTQKDFQRKHDIDQIILQPGPVTTPLIQNCYNWWSHCMPDETIEAVLKNLGSRNYCWGAQLHRYYGLQINWTPEWVRNIQKQQEGAAIPRGSYKCWTHL